MRKPLYYLATPYTLYGQGREQAFIEACKAAATLMLLGRAVYSPIAHSHPIAVHGGLDAIDHDFWISRDLDILEECDALLVVEMPGWRESRGVMAEIEFARKMGKPITYLSWPCLNERSHESRRHL